MPVFGDFEDDSDADVLLSLVKSSDERDNLQAYQIGFNLFEMDLRNFKRRRGFSRFCFFHDWTNSSQEGQEQKEAESKRGRTRWCQFCRRDAGKVVLGIFENEIARGLPRWWKN